MLQYYCPTKANKQVAGPFKTRFSDYYITFVNTGVYINEENEDNFMTI